MTNKENIKQLLLSGKALIAHEYCQTNNCSNQVVFNYVSVLISEGLNIKKTLVKVGRRKVFKYNI